MTLNPALASVYTIYLYNHTGTAVLLLVDYEYLEYNQRVSSAWNHIIRINMAPDDPRLTFFRSTLVRDYIINIYRTDPLTGVVDLAYEGLHRTAVDQIKMDGSVVITLYGVGYTQLLSRRVVVPEAGQENSKKTGVAETIMKQYVSEQAVSPTDVSRTIQGLTNQADAAQGATAEYTARYTNLLTVISRCAEQGAVEFGIVGGATPGTFSFRVASIWGTDRRVGNAGGTPPTLFDVELNNMVIPILSNHGSDEVNSVYVGGAGTGTGRVITEVQNTTAMAVSPWNRSEAFVDARSEDSADGVTTRGQAYLKEHEAGYKFTFNNQQTQGTRWLRDWELGDLISARYGDLLFHKRITQVSVVVSAGETGQSVIEVITLEMIDVPAP